MDDQYINEKKERLKRFLNIYNKKTYDDYLKTCDDIIHDTKNEYKYTEAQKFVNTISNEIENITINIFKDE